MLLGRWGQPARFSRAILLVTLAVVLSTVAAGCIGASVTSKQLYETNCAECHGEFGNRLPIARLDSKEFLASIGEAGLVAATRDGKGAMPAWGKAKGGPLDDRQIVAIVQYLETGRPQPEKVAQTNLEGDNLDQLIKNPAVLMMLFTVCVLGFLWTMNRVTSH